MTDKYTFQVITVWDNSFFEEHSINCYHFSEAEARQQLEYYLQEYRDNGDDIFSVTLTNTEVLPE